VAVSGNTPYGSHTVRESVLLAETSPLSCHNRKVSGYIAACPVIIEKGVFYKTTQKDSYCHITEKITFILYDLLSKADQYQQCGGMLYDQL